jgi:hypothetical protein
VHTGSPSLRCPLPSRTGWLAAKGGVTEWGQTGHLGPRRAHEWSRSRSRDCRLAGVRRPGRCSLDAPPCDWSPVARPYRTLAVLEGAGPLALVWHKTGETFPKSQRRYGWDSGGDEHICSSEWKGPLTRGPVGCLVSEGAHWVWSAIHGRAVLRWLAGCP